MRSIKLDINFYKVIAGVGFSLLWAKVMYLVWDKPSYITFIWFYLGIGSVLLKWVLFVIIDQIHVRFRRRAVRKELEQSIVRIEKVSKDMSNREKQAVTIDHMVNIDIEEKFKQLEQNVLHLGNMVEEAMEQTIEGLKKRDAALATRIVKNDHLLDRNESAIREDCLKFITNNRLEYSDIRRVVAILGITTELERMGDYAEGIAKISLMMGTQPLLKPLVDIPLMKQLGIEMLRGSLDSFFKSNPEEAKLVYHMDDEVDALYDQVFRELVLYMIEDPKTITRATRLIWVAHNLERFADRATNICEQAFFSATGETMDTGASKY